MQDDRAGSDGKRERQIALRVADLSGGEGDVVPGIGGKQRSDLRHGDHRNGGDQRGRSADADGNFVQRAQPGVEPEVGTEICAERLRRASNPDAEQDEPQQARDFGGGKHHLHDGSGLDAEDVDRGEQHDDGDGNQVLGVQPDLHVAQHHGAEMNRRNLPEVHDPVRGGDGRKEDAEKLAEGDADRGNRAALNHQEERPAVEEAPQRPERLSQVDILAAGVGHHRRQFAVGERRHHGHEAGHQPCRNQQGGRVHDARDVGGHDEDARSDHRAHHQRGGAGEPQAFYKFLILTGMRWRSRADSPLSLIRMFSAIKRCCNSLQLAAGHERKDN